MADTPSYRDEEERKLAGAKGEGGEGTDPSGATPTGRAAQTPDQVLASTAGEGRQDPDNRTPGLGGGYGGQGGGDSGNALTGTAEGPAGGATGNPDGAYDFPEMAQARAMASAAGQPGLATPPNERREQAGGETPAKE